MLTLPSSRKISDLLSGLVGAEQLTTDVEVSSIADNSNDVAPGSLFLAIPGGRVDARSFIPEVVAKGAVCIVTEGSGNFEVNVPVLRVESSRRCKAELAKRVFYNAADRLEVYGVTGTNGKTTVAYVLSEVLNRLGVKACYLGTLGCKMRLGDKMAIDYDPGVTTPDPFVLHSFFNDAVARGATHAAIEVSSHALAQQRVGGIQFRGGVFTNVTRDHLDYHQTFEAYTQVKRSFVEETLKNSTSKAIVAINQDDPVGNSLIENNQENPSMRIGGFSLKRADCDAYVINYHPSVEQTQIEASVLGQRVSFNTALVGYYNVANCLSVMLLLRLRGFLLKDIVRAISEVEVVPGRLERIAKQGKTVFVDYAHTPDALKTALGSLREIVQGRIITVFGCGGDRDKGKRPLMAKEVATASDLAVVTSDNPRTEDPNAIIADIVAGFANASLPLKVEPNRLLAIEYAISQARPEDVVLVAGKGHEDYQEIDGVKHHFSDQEVCRKLMGFV